MNACQDAGYAMISQPMGKVPEEEILAVRKEAERVMKAKGFTVLNTYFDITANPIGMLAKSIEEMSKCNAVYFCKGWETARGCVIEHEIAQKYGLELYYAE